MDDCNTTSVPLQQEELIVFSERDINRKAQVNKYIELYTRRSQTPNLTAEEEDSLLDQMDDLWYGCDEYQHIEIDERLAVYVYDNQPANMTDEDWAELRLSTSKRFNINRLREKWKPIPLHAND